MRLPYNSIAWQARCVCVTQLFMRWASLLGIFVLMGIAWLLSNNKRKFPWRVAIFGVGLQFAFALFILKTPAGLVIFDNARRAIVKLLSFTDAGAKFLFGSIYTGAYSIDGEGPYQIYDPNTAQFVPIGIIFALHVLLTIVFFASLMSVLYHVGAMQWIVRFFAFIMRRTMGTSGAETLSAASNIFVGQTEAPLVVRPYVGKMTQSELMAVMCGGFATAAGGVLAAYTRFGIDPGHLMAASVMSAPAALVMAKIMFPETEEPLTKGDAPIKSEKTTANLVDAAATGARDGLHLAMNVAAMLLAFIALIAMINWGLGKIQPDLSLAKIFGWVFAPLALAMGVEAKDAQAFGSLLGTQISLNEFVAYLHLGQIRDAISPRTFDMATYALCGFANFSSIAIQIGGISTIAPERRRDLARVGLRAMLAGALACYQTSTIAGALISPEESAARYAQRRAEWQPDSMRYADRIASYAKFARDYPDTEWAKQAQTRIESLRNEAETTYKKLDATAKSLARDGKIGDARAVYQQIMVDFAGKTDEVDVKIAEIIARARVEYESLSEKSHPK
jgi:CNT family concentrative nucleoside transporter